MTYIVGVTNLANWNGEDIEIDQRDINGPVKLVPGQSMTFGHPDHIVGVRETPKEKTDPFMHEDQGQLVPWLMSGIGPTIEGSPAAKVLGLRLPPQPNTGVNDLRRLAVRLYNQIVTSLPDDGAREMAILNLQQTVLWLDKAEQLAALNPGSKSGT